MPTGGPHRRGIPGVALVASVLLIAIVVNALVIGQNATVTPTARTPLPVTMASLHVSTTVTSSVTASTVNLLVTTVPTQFLDFDRSGSLDWNLQLVVTSATGITGSESLRFTVAGDTTQTVTITSGSSFPSSATSVVMDADGVVVSASATNAIALCVNCGATVELRLTSVSPASPGLLFVYPLSFDSL